MTPKEISEKLNVSPASVRRYIRTGQLKAHKNRLSKGQGGQWVVEEVDLQEFINALNSEY